MYQTVVIPLETMLRMYLMQNWFGLSDEGIEDAVYDSYAMKRFLIHYYLLFASANLVMCLRAGRQREFCMTMG